MSLKIHNMLLVVALLTTFISFTQTEDEVRVNADALFKNKQYVEATPLYLRLLSLQPRSYDYSYKYGTCLLFNSNSKQDAIRYLGYAIKSPTPIPEANFFLGKAYHLNYQFNDAISEYRNYLSKAGNKGEYFGESNRNIAMCENGKNLLTTLTDVIVRKRTEIKQDDFFRLYDLAEIGGSIIVAVDFQTKNDKKYNHKPIVHIAPNMENVYFSSYGDGDNLDLYVVRKLPGGKFGIPQKLSGAINTPFDEDFPYMHPNGNELYFSSKGHNSMGGYDIFKSKFNAENNAFEEVTNVDFSISSPDDDLLYVVDKDNKNAYFSSRRQSQDGKIVVYKVAVERIPIQLAIVKGTFASSLLPAGSKMTVEVVDKTNGKKIGVFKTLKESTYLITFPKGGKYQYNVTIEGSNETFTVDVDIPFLKELRPLKQKMDHELADTKERIRITNLFDEQVEDAQSIVSQVLKERANLNVNEDQYNTEELEGQAKLKAALAELRLNTRSPMEFGQLLERTHTELKQTATGENKIERSVDAISRNLYNEIAVIDTEIRALVKEADASESNRRKELVLTNAKELYQQRENKLEKIRQVQTEAAAIGTTGNTISVNPEKLGEISKQYNQLLNEGKTAELVTLLNQNKAYLSNVLSAPTQTTASEELLKKQDEIVNEITRLQSIENGYVEEINRLENEIVALTQQRDAAKDKFKQEFQDKIDAKTYELENAKSSLSKTRNLIPAAAQRRDENNRKLNIVNEIESYQGKPATKEELAKVKAIVSDEKIKTLQSYIDASLKELSSQPANDPKGTKTEVAIEQYNTQSEEIYANTDWSDYEKQERLLTLNDQKQQELMKYLQELETNTALDETTKIQQKNTTQKLVQELQHDQQLLQDAIAVSAKNEIAQLTTQNIVQELYPGYEENKQTIKQNTQLSESEQLQQLNSNDQQLADKITVEVNQLKAGQATAKESSLSAAKINLLEEHRSQLQTTIAERKQQTERLQNELNAAQELDKQISSVAQQVESAYSDNLQKFNQLNADTNSDERIEVLTNLSTTLAAQQQQLQQLKSKSPSNQTVATVLTALETKISEVTALLTTEKTAQATANQTNNQTATTFSKTPSVIIEELQQSYEGIINNDFSQAHTTTADIQQNIQRLNDYKTTVQQALATAETTASEAEKTAYRAAAEQEIQRIDKRIIALQQQQQAIEQQNTAQTNNQTATTSSKTPSVIIEELQQSYEGSINNDFSQEHTTTADVQQNIQRLNDYKMAVQQALATAETTASEAEKTAYRAAAEQEIQRIDKRINTLQQQQQVIEQQNTAQTNNQTATTSSKTPSVIIEELQQSYEGSINNDFSQAHTTTADVQQNIQRLNDYKTTVQQALATAETTASEAEKTAYRVAAEQEIQRIDKRINALQQQQQTIEQQNTVQTNNQTATTLSKTPSVIIEELQQSYEGSINNDFSQTHTTTADIQQNIQRLNDYKTAVQQALATAEKNASEQEKTAYRAAAEQEIQRIDKRISALQQQQEAIEQQNTAQTNTPDSTDRTTPTTREQSIAAKLADEATSAKERKELTKELTVLKQETAIENIRQKEEQLQELTNSISKAENMSGNPVSTTYAAKSAALSTQIQSEKDPLKKELLVDELLKVREQQAEQIERTQTLEENTAIVSNNPEARIYSEEQLKARKRQGIIEIEELTAIRSLQQQQMTTASKKEKQTLAQEIDALNEREAVIKRELAFIDAQLEKYSPLDKTPSLTENTVALTYNEERSIASSEEYESYAKAIADQNKLVAEHAALKKELNEEQMRLELIRNREKTAETDEKVLLSDQKSAAIERIKNISVSLKGLEVTINEATQTASIHLPADSIIGMKFQNLVARGINPIKKSLIAATLIPISVNGIEYNPTASTLPELKKIPVEVKTPMGLIYRVQVGAFAKPIPESHFKEFSPVSGEKIENSAITRYMAGYFNTASTVVEAREKIRQLGYNDAFVVAYCDGKRISFGEARQLEARNECIGKKAEEIQVEVATNIAQNLGLEDTSKTLKPVAEHTYNQAPGAAKAWAIEQFNKDQIFFTVQVGVFNRPVTRDLLFNLEPLYTLRLDNGQIRYSVGMYGDLMHAVTLQSEVRKKGIPDAFVVAYYQGNRISVSKARELINSGVPVYTGTPNPQPKVESHATNSDATTVIPVFSAGTTGEVITRPESYVQFITKKTYEQYPREELNRYNSKGNFYYDNNDKHIKSTFYSDAFMLPRIAAFAEEVDTLRYTKSDVLKSNDSRVTFQINGSSIPGDFNDWLTKFPYRKAYAHSENGIEIHIFDIQLEEVREMKIISELFGYPLTETQNTSEYERNDE